MSVTTTRVRRLGLVSAASVTAALAFGTAQAHADEPVSRTVELSTATTGKAAGGCSSFEVWGVAVGDDRGNYEVCTYISSKADVQLGDIDDATRQAVESKIRTTAGGETAARDMVAYCPYWLPSGPNRTPQVTYTTKSYQVQVVDHYADGSTNTVYSGSGAYWGPAAVSWTPGCWTR
ncbi:hypothetical protein [Streptomyces sp. NPDC007264]|uniref:hypothetical protein n=1 Tax=Streptomyces sp. NPDC007264 TaxID=3364777 RepID=UPI0036DC5BFE